MNRPDFPQLLNNAYFSLEDMPEIAWIKNDSTLHHYKTEEIPDTLAQAFTGTIQPFIFSQTLINTNDLFYALLCEHLEIIEAHILNTIYYFAYPEFIHTPSANFPQLPLAEKCLCLDMTMYLSDRNISDLIHYESFMVWEKK